MEIQEDIYFVLYPISIDSTKTLKNGRKYPLTHSIQQPKMQEIKNALDKLKLEYMEEPNKRHPKEYANFGRFKIKKMYGKNFVVNGIIQMISDDRNRKVAQSMNKGKIENKLGLVAKKKNKKNKKRV